MKTIIVLLGLVAGALSCGRPPSISDAYLRRYSYNSQTGTATYKCYPGITQTGTGDVTCTGGQWGVADISCGGSGGGSSSAVAYCSKPNMQVDNAYRAGYSYGSSSGSATYKCYSGYTQTGTGEATCTNGVWGTPDITCTERVKVSCPEPPERFPARVGGTGWKSCRGVRTEIAYYKCEVGTLNGESKGTCSDEDGQWITPTFTCTGGASDDPNIKDCGQPYQPTAPFSTPEPADAVTGPPSLCLVGDASTEMVSISIPETVDRHNCWRRNVNPPAKNPLPELIWDEDLARVAERWAASCPTSEIPHDSGSDRHVTTYSDVGQNVCFASYSRSMSACIDAWSMEVKDFQMGVGSINGNVVGHYTQVVAERSTHVGCGWAICSNGQYYPKPTHVQVCNYGPAGNYNGGGKTPYEAA